VTVRLSNFTTKNDGWDQPPVCGLCREYTQHSTLRHARFSHLARACRFFYLSLFYTVLRDTSDSLKADICIYV